MKDRHAPKRNLNAKYETSPGSDCCCIRGTNRIHRNGKTLISSTTSRSSRAGTVQRLPTNCSRFPNSLPSQRTHGDLHSPVAIQFAPASSLEGHNAVIGAITRPQILKDASIFRFTATPRGQSPYMGTTQPRSAHDCSSNSIICAVPHMGTRMQVYPRQQISTI
jgi:hypothetical protein